MHGKFLKKVIAVTLAIALVLGGLPLMAGRLISAMASTNVSTYEDLRDALARDSGGVQKETVEVTLADDITVNSTLFIDSSLKVVIDGDGHTITVATPGTDEDGRIDVAATATTLIQVLESNTAQVTIKNATLIGGRGSALVNDSGATATLESVNVTRTAGEKTIINKKAVLVLDGCNISRNIANDAVISNENALNPDNTTLQINNSYINENRANMDIILTQGKTSVSSSTIAGNIAQYYVYKDLSSVVGSSFTESDVSGNVSKGLYFEKPASLHKTTVLYNHEYADLGNLVDITLSDDANTAEFILDNVKYGNAFNIDNVTNSVGVEQITTLNSKNIFKNYSNFHVVAADGKYTRSVILPTIYNGKHVLPDAFVNTKKVYVEAGENGSVTNGNIFGNVLKINDPIVVAATPDSGYEFMDWIGIDGNNNAAVKSTNSSFSYNGSDESFLLKAEFAKASTATVKLFLNGSAWGNQSITLNKYGTPVATLAGGTGSNLGVYTGSVYTGKYDVYVNGIDSEIDINVTETGVTLPVEYVSLEYTLDGGTGTVPSIAYYPKGTEVSLASAGDLSKDGYKFAGWIYDFAGAASVYEPGTVMGLNNGTVLKPYWSPLTIDAEITVNTDGQPDSGFDVSLYNIQTGLTYNLAYSNGVYKGVVDNDSSYTYQVKINNTPVGTPLNCNQLQTATFDHYKLKFYGNGNTDGQSEYTRRILKDTDFVLPNTFFEKKGHEFVAWNGNVAGSGSDHFAGETVTVTGPRDFYAKWQAKTYQVTLDVDGGDALPVADRTRMVTFGGQYGSLPTPTRTGYRFLYWVEGSQIVTGTTNVTKDSDHTLKAVWTPNEYTISVPSGESMKFTLTPDSGTYTVNHGTNYGFTIEPIEGFSIDNAVVSYVETGSGNEPTVISGTNGHYEIPAVDSDKTIMVTGVADLIAPTGSISIRENRWTSFLNTISFGLFYKESQIVTFTAEDVGSGVAGIYYYNVMAPDSPLTLDEVMAIPDDMWTLLQGTNKVEVLAPENEVVVYAKLVDNAGNVGYISSDGVVLDTTPPEITGAMDGGTYDGPLTLTVTDAHLDYVTANGVTRALQDDGSFSIAGQADPVEVIAYDKAGNMTKITITVNISQNAPSGNVTEEFKSEGDTPSTQLSTEENSLDKAVLSDADKTAISQGEDINIRVEVKDDSVVPESDKTIVSDNSDDKVVFKIFDISVFKDYLMRGTSQQVTRTDGALTFVFEIPEELREAPEGYERIFFLGRVHEGEFTWLTDKDTSLVTLTTDTNLFSTYVLAYKDAPIVQNIEEENEGESTTAAPAGESTTASDSNTGTNTGADTNATTGNGEQVANTDKIVTGDNAPILLTAVLVVFGASGAIIFDKKRRGASRSK